MIPYTTSIEIIYNISRQFNTLLDLDEALGKVLRLTVEAMGAARGSLFLLDEQGRVTQHILARPDQSPEVIRQNLSKVMEDGLAGWVYRHRYGALAADTTTDKRWVRLPNDSQITGSAIVVPLLHQERVSGLLALHHLKVNYFDESHLALATGIANQAAVALENARLFTQVNQERESLYRLTNGMPIPVLVVTPSGRLTFANEPARQALLLQAVDVPLSTIEGGSQLLAALAKLKEEEGTRLEVDWPDGRVFNVSVSHISNHELVVALSDITHLKELDAMKSQFVETVSHDLKNPLSVIIGFIQVMELEQQLSKNGQSSLRGIKQSAEQMQALISNLLDLARIGANIDGDAEIYDFAQLITEALSAFQMQLYRTNQTLTTDLPAEPLWVKGNRTRLLQIVSNYVGNAIKYTAQNGKIKVTAGQRGQEVRLYVTDNGPGISPAGQAQLFQKFYRVPEIHAKTGQQGTGLGLSIVKAIVEAYGGRVWVESEIGRGSTFSCALPLVNAPNSEPAGPKLEQRR